MNTIDISAVRWLAKSRPKDLHDLIMGTSPYSQDENAAELSTDTGNCDLITLTIHHLLFVQRFRKQDVDGEWDRGRYYPSHAQAFEKWIHNGCPGLSSRELARYIENQPIT